jgi:homoserine acetyltransferase
MVYYPWSVTARYLDRISPHNLGQEVEATAQSFAAWDANSLVWRFAACRSFDVAAPFSGDLGAALAPVTMPVLLLPIAGDRLYGLSGARQLRDGLARASYIEIPSDLGHHAVDSPPDTEAAAQIERLVRDFLAPGK